MSRDFDIEQLPLREFTERAYLDYSMYVILDRALPHVADGLKPVLEVHLLDFERDIYGAHVTISIGGMRRAIA